VRIIAATSKDLIQEARKGTFREDLFYRLNVIQIGIPPLRERREDIEPLAKHFLAKYNREMSKQVIDIDPVALEKLKNYNWPGNVRELENALEYMAGMEPGEIITMDRVPSRIRSKRPDVVSPDMPLDALLQKYEEDLLRQKLTEMGDMPGKKEKLADMLQVSRATMYRKLKKFGIL